MFKNLINRIRGIHVMHQYYQNKIDIGKVKRGSIWSRSKCQPTYICLQYPDIMTDTATILNRRIFRVYKKQEFSNIVVGCVYKNGDPKIPFMRLIENPGLVGEPIGVHGLVGLNVEQLDFLIKRNLEIEEYVKNNC